MSNHVYLNIKVGNAANLKDGMVESIYDPVEWGHSAAQENAHFSRRHRKVYQPVRVPRSFAYKRMVSPLGRVLSGTGPLSGDFDMKSSDYAARSAAIDLDRLGVLIGDADLRTRLNSPNPVSIIDLSTKGISESEFVDPRTLLKDARDFNAVTSGNHTIGTAKDYATVSAFFSDVGNLTGNISGTVETDTTETAQSSLTVTYNNFDFSLLTDLVHGGIVTAGHVVSSSYDAAGTILINGTAGTGETIVNGLNFAKTSNPGASKAFIQASEINTTFKNIYMDGQENSNCLGLYFFGGGNVNGFMSNCISWGCNYGVVVDFAGSVIDNCGAYNCSISGMYGGSVTGTMRSCYSLGSTSDDYALISSLTRDNLASSDATATGTAPQINLTTANEIETSDTDANFMHPLNDSATVWENGNTSHTESEDAAGVTWDASNPSIGPFQGVSAAGGVAAMIHRRDFRNTNLQRGS